jgi:hypothetical protein
VPAASTVWLPLLKSSFLVPTHHTGVARSPDENARLQVSINRSRSRSISRDSENAQDQKLAARQCGANPLLKREGRDCLSADPDSSPTSYCMLNILDVSDSM